MLKIKDNIDLKELEKYGFKDACDWFYEFKHYDGCRNTFEIDKYNKKISVETNVPNACLWTHCRDLDILFDLISDGLVEKVEEKWGGK